MMRAALLNSSNKTIHDRLGTWLKDRLGHLREPFDDNDTQMSDNLAEGQNSSVFSPPPKTKFQEQMDSYDKNIHDDEQDMTDLNNKNNTHHCWFQGKKWMNPRI